MGRRSIRLNGIEGFRVFRRLGDRKPTWLVSDWDETHSRLRAGWQAIMFAMMIAAIIRGTKLRSAQRKKIVTAVERLIQRSTGRRTIEQMEELVLLVERFGLTKPKSAAEYKLEYNVPLMQLVYERLQQLYSTPDAIDELAVTGSLRFLVAARKRGATLGIFSGTDQNNVQNESFELIQRAGLDWYQIFQGNVWGSTPDRGGSAKGSILPELLWQRSLSAKQLIVAGDGPEELEAGRAVGAYLIAVTSDPQRVEFLFKLVPEIHMVIDHWGRNRKETNALVGYLFGRRPIR